MVARKLIVTLAVTQLLAAVVFLALNELANASKFVAFRNVTIAHHEGGDVEAELRRSIRKVGDHFYRPAVVFGGACALSSLLIGLLAVRWLR